MSDATVLPSPLHPVLKSGVHSSLFTEGRKAWAYFKKEFLIQASYRFSFVVSVFGIFTSIATFFFIDRLFGSQITRDLAPYGTSYFAYVLVGNAFFMYVGTALGGVSGLVAGEQSMGTLEAIFTTPTRLWILILAMTIWNTVYASVGVITYFVVGGVGFGIDFSRINWVSLVCIFLPLVVTFNSLGLLEAGCILVFKRGTFTAWAFNGVWALLGGVFFPVTVLPDWLQRISECIPITHAIRAVQLAIYQGATVTELTRELMILGMFCVVLTPLGILSWNWLLRRAKMEGSLSQH